MKKFFLLIILVNSLVFVTAQRHEVGISVGAANVIGDIGRSDYIQPPFPDNLQRIPISLGFLYRYNLNSRQSLRFNFIYSKLYFNDEKASEDYRFQRNAKGDNTLLEFSGLFEYNFFDINDERRYGFSPYIFGGVALYGYDDKNFVINHRYLDGGLNTQVVENAETKYAFAIPFGAGLKFKFKYNWVLGFEVGARYTFQNNLDYSDVDSDKFTVNVSVPQSYVPEANKKTNRIIGQHQTGSTKNDWYLIYGLNLTYSFGRPPCYCY